MPDDNHEQETPPKTMVAPWKGTVTRSGESYLDFDDARNLNDFLRQVHSDFLGFDFDTVRFNVSDWNTVRKHNCEFIELELEPDLLKNHVRGYCDLPHGPVTLLAHTDQPIEIVSFYEHGEEMNTRCCPGCAGKGYYAGLRVVEDPCTTCGGLGCIRSDQ